MSSTSPTPTGRTSAGRVAHVIASILLALLLIPFTFVIWLLSSLLGSCAYGCEGGLQSYGVWGPITIVAIGIIGLVGTVVQLARYRLAFWIPLAAAFAMSVVLLVGMTIS